MKQKQLTNLLNLENHPVLATDTKKQNKLPISLTHSLKALSTIK